MEEQVSASSGPERTKGLGIWAGVTVGVAVWLGLLIVTGFGAPNLTDNDQARPALYALDALRNGAWIAQRDQLGETASKPPLHTWIVALSGLARDRIELWNLYLPSAGAMLVLTLIITVWGGRRLGAGAGALGAVALLVSPYGLKHLTLVRTDALFAAMVSLGAIGGYRAWNGGRSWLPFWIACTAATLTKGPVGVVLAASGLLVMIWEKPEGGERGAARGMLGRHGMGVALLLGVSGVWLALGYRELGRPFIDTLIGRELVGHMLSRPKGDGFPGSEFYQPMAYFVSRFAPWSVATLLGLWRVYRRPSVDVEERRGERFVALWFVGGLVLFSLSPHQRPDLLLPILAPASMLAGGEMARWLGVWRSRRLALVAVGIGLIGVAVGVGRERYIRGADAEVGKTAELRRLAGRIEARFGRVPGIVDIDANPVLQVFLNTMSVRVTVDQGAEILAALADPMAFAATTEPEALIEALEVRGVSGRVVDGVSKGKGPRVTIVVAGPEL